MRLIKIPKSSAEIIGRISYVKDGISCEINPFCSEQMDGCYLMDEQTYLSVKDIPEVKAQFDQVDFNSFERITEAQIDLKENL